jgi:hypothetical protein
MATMFYIGTRPQANNRSYIHTKDCPLLPSPGKRIFLGTFLSPEESAEEGKKHFNNPGYCPFCLHGDRSVAEGERLAETFNKPDFITHIGIKPTWESALVCGVN